MQVPALLSTSFFRASDQCTSVRALLEQTEAGFKRRRHSRVVLLSSWRRWRAAWRHPRRRRFPSRVWREQPSGGRLLTVGALLAGATMFVRVLALVAALRPQSLGFVALPIGAGLAVLLGAAALLSVPSKQATRAADPPAP